MELPLCKICGDRHRLGGCPKFHGMEADERRKWFKGMSSGAPKTPERKASESRAREAQEESPVAVALDQGHPQAKPIQAAAPPLKAKFDKKAYQRDLMRKRRAKAKAGQQA